MVVYVTMALHSQSHTHAFVFVYIDLVFNSLKFIPPHIIYNITGKDCITGNSNITATHSWLNMKQKKQCSYCFPVLRQIKTFPCFNLSEPTHIYI